MQDYDPHATPDVEVAEVLDFLRAHAPFNALPEPMLQQAAHHLEIEYHRKGTTVLAIGDASTHLYMVRAGAVELHDDEGTLVARLGEGQYVGYPSLLTGQTIQRRVHTIEDTLLYRLPAATFDRLRSASDAFDAYFNRAHAERIRAALTERRTHRTTLTVPIRALLRREPVCIAPDASIRAAAQRMRDERVSSLLIRTDDRLVGILTDRDLRTRVVAEGTDLDAPVATVMTEDPITIPAQAYAFEALLTMSRRNVHHLPVIDRNALAGMVTTTDLMRLQAASPVYLIGDVWKQDDVDGLVRISERLPELVLHLVDADATAHDVGHAVTAVSDALTRRLLALAEDHFGPPPVPYAWVALGSQARHEQTAHSDQDHALLLSDAASDDEDAYFTDLARFVSEGLNACGYVYCPGDVMATNATWRQPLRTWHGYFDAWINEPSPKALMHSSIFFDMRQLHGDEALTTTLLEGVRQQCRGNTIFLASLAANALQYRPPLGFFRQFVLERHGGQDKTLDLKHQGVVPAVDLARVYALGAGVGAINTQARLDALAATKAMAASDAANLRDAHAFIAYVRLQHQGRQLRAGEAPDNYVSPDALSPFERRHLKDAFTVISQMQSALAQKYQTSMIS